MACGRPRRRRRRIHNHFRVAFLVDFDDRFFRNRQLFHALARSDRRLVDDALDLNDDEIVDSQDRKTLIEDRDPFFFTFNGRGEIDDEDLDKGISSWM